MELNESSAEGAARETQEEAGCQVQIIAPYAHWDVSHWWLAVQNMLICLLACGCQPASMGRQEHFPDTISLLFPFQIPVIGQAYILFRAKILPPYTIASKTSEVCVSILCWC